MTIAIPISIAVVLVAVCAWDAVRRAIEARRLDDQAALHDARERLHKLEQDAAGHREELRRIGEAAFRRGR